MIDKEHKILSKYLPLELVDFALQQLKMYQIDFTISKSRQSKLGDYRPKLGKKPHRLSVNGDLSTKRFALTFLHELAHLKATEKYGWKKIEAHGKEWKEEFRQLIFHWIGMNTLDMNDHKALLSFSKNPSATARKDPFLIQEIRKNGKNILADISVGGIFTFKNEKFKKVKKNRTRSLCQRTQDKKLFLISESAEVNSLAL